MENGTTPTADGLNRHYPADQLGIHVLNPLGVQEPDTRNVE